MKESNGDSKSKVLKSSKKKKREGLASVCIGSDLLQIHGETSQQNKIKRNKENRGWSRINKVEIGKVKKKEEENERIERENRGKGQKEKKKRGTNKKNSSRI